MNLATILPVVATTAGAVAMVAVFWWSKPHKEHVENQEQEAGHVTAISAASKTLAEAVSVLIEPLNQSIVRLQTQEREMAVEMAKVKAELVVIKSEHRRVNKDLEALIRYVRMLWTQIEETGARPVPLPDELLHVVWEDPG